MNSNKIYSTCSLGFKCIASQILINLKIKKESYPFDWIISNLDIVKHCIQDDFKIFLDKKYYSYTNKDNKLIEEEKFLNYYLLNKNRMDNSKGFFQDKRSFQDKRVYHNYYSSSFKLFAHYNPKLEKDYEYYERCINRFK